MSHKKIKTALISVFDKTGLKPLLEALVEQGVSLYSTGGTESYIRELGHEVNAVEDLTGYPSILGGRVKTLHPKVFGGILNRQNVASDQQELKQYEIPQLDLVIVDLYPFENTVASGASEQDIIEKIDIGGISLIRAAAKNFKDVTIIASKNQYAELEARLSAQDGATTLEDRRYFAAQAFQVSSKIDSRTILDTKGADTLIGRGDMLFSPPGSSRLVRAQGAFVSDEEVQEMVEFLKRNSPPQYAQSVQQQIDRAAREDDEEGGGGEDGDLGDDGELYQEALEVLKATKRASTSMIQRKLRIGYNRAARLIEAMEAAGVVSAMNSNGSREVLVPKRD